MHPKIQHRCNVNGSLLPTFAFSLSLMTAALSGCGSYEPPVAGTHRGPGEPGPDIICAYETATASRFMQMRCQRADDKNARGETDRQAADSIRTPVPDVK
jgi:hypothetical protein